MKSEAIYTVLVAEDEELIRNQLVRRIHSLGLGFKVIATVQDGQEALDMLEKVSPDLLVTDIRMPVMDGLSLLERLHGRHRQMVRMVVSGYHEFEYAKQAMKYDAREYLLKPVRKEQLEESLRHIREHLDSTRESLLEAINTRAGQHHTTEEIARMVCAYLQSHYREDISLEALAQKFSFNASYLSKIFSRHIGDTPSRYLTRLRIDSARHLLISEQELPVRDIGFLVGYPDQYHFSHAFKQWTGTSPAAYRDAILSGAELSAFTPVAEWPDEE